MRRSVSLGVACTACIASVGVAIRADTGTDAVLDRRTLDAYSGFAAQLDAATGFGLSVEPPGPDPATGLASVLVRARDAPDAPVVGRLSQRIEPAPRAFPGGPRIGLARIVTTPVPDSDAEPASGASMTSLVGLDRRIGHALSASEWRLRLGTVDHAGEGLAYGVLSSPDGALSGAGRIERAAVDDGRFRAEVRGLRDGWAFARADGGPYREGEYAATADALALGLGPGVPFGFEGVTVDARTSVERGRLDALAGFDAAAVDAPLDVDAASATLRLDGLDADGTFRYLRELDETLYDVPPDGIGAAVAGMRVGPGAALLSGTALGLDVRLDNAGGVFDLALKLALDADAPAASGIVTVGDLLGAMSGSLALEADPAALARTPAAPWMELARIVPWVDTRGPRWRVRVTLADATLRVNGLPVPLEAVLGDAMALPLGRALRMLMSADEG